MGIPMADPSTGAAPPAAQPPALTLDMKAGLDRLVKENDIVLFMKGTPESPRCGFSARAAGALQELGHPFHAVDIFTYGSDVMTTVRALAEWADFPTLPQVWVKGELVGGSDIALEMLQSGDLKRMLA